MRHFLIATVLGSLAGALLAAFFLVVDLTPLQASQESGELDHLLKSYLGISGFIFGLVTVVVFYSVVVFRRERPDQHGAGFRGHTVLERSWIAVTTLLVLLSAADAIAVLDHVMGPRPGYAQTELEVKATGMQWMWQFEYPQYGVASRELVLEQHRPVLLRLASRDVVHSLFIPEFRMKFDAMPGTETQMRVVPTLVGDFSAPCAELCGLAHSAMTAPVRVLAADDFARWLAEQPKN